MTQSIHAHKACFIGLVAILSQAVFGVSATADTTEVAFRYPDQVNISYTSEGDIVSNTTPMAFSSQKAAITQAQAQALAGTAPRAKTSAPSFVKGLEPRQITTGYFVKIGSFTDMKRAMKQADTIPLAQFVSANVQGTTYYRVLVGPFDTKADANQTKATLITQGIPTAYVIDKT